MFKPPATTMPFSLFPQIYYVSSALSFYFIYDFCLYNKMSPLISYFLRYLPLFVAAITTTVMFIMRRRLKKHALPWHGLWWIVLLLYTHILHTSMSILNCPILPGRDDSHVPVSLLHRLPNVQHIIYVYFPNRDGM